MSVVGLVRHNDKGSGLLMLVKDTIPIVNNAAAIPQSVDSHLQQKYNSTTMPNRKQLHMHNIYISPSSSCCFGHNTLNEHLLSNKEVSIIVGDINSHESTWEMDTIEDEDGEQLNTIKQTAQFFVRMKQYG